MKERPAVDTALLHSRPDRVARRVRIRKNDGIHPEDVARPRRLGGEMDTAGSRQRCERVSIPAGDPTLLLDEAWQLLDLRGADGRLQVRHSVVEADDLVPVMAL